MIVSPPIAGSVARSDWWARMHQMKCDLLLLRRVLEGEALMRRSAGAT